MSESGVGETEEEEVCVGADIKSRDKKKGIGDRGGGGRKREEGGRWGNLSWSVERNGHFLDRDYTQRCCREISHKLKFLERNTYWDAKEACYMVARNFLDVA